METLKETNPIARKEHKCMYCNGIINKGQRYNRQTIAFDGSVYDWICHEECLELSGLLDMTASFLDEGVSEDGFHRCVEEYVYTNHYDNEADDIAKEWQVPMYEQVKMIIKELEMKKTKKIEIEVPAGKTAKWIDGVLTLIDE